MHFLNKIIESPQIGEPIEKHMDIHRHFYRYSRGDFIGPALKLKRTASRITLKGSLEYEDLVQEIVAHTLPKKEIEIDFVLISGKDITDFLTEMNLDWDMKKSTGKTKNYKAKQKDVINKEKLLEIIEEFRENCYFLLTFNEDSTCRVKTKKRIPQPSKKKIGEDDVNSRTQFCYGVVDNTDANSSMIVNKALPDFISEIDDEWKNIILYNNYKIENILVPKGIKDSRLMRIMAIREGKLFRTLELDGETFEKQYSIRV
ncbi:MAG: hypothetical protein GF383_13610 [Candidatus Lokiarchaeota archaeon]|nr:hypothetical protein [Candidatus Lokiarchaeota archaeon]MBD3342262.1 hypothetical protein [Candidatus Lokiarchaeota archaeon]